ncbi:MAG: transposase [Candidatus Entotheonellia bacterium]
MWIEARTKLPLAAKGVPIQEHETRSLRALVTQARTNLAGHARLHTVVFDRGLLDGVALWWLQQHGLLFVVPAKENLAVTIDAQAQAAAACIRYAMARAKRPGPNGSRPRSWASPA